MTLNQNPPTHSKSLLPPAEIGDKLYFAYLDLQERYRDLEAFAQSMGILEIYHPKPKQSH